MKRILKLFILALVGIVLTGCSFLGIGYVEIELSNEEKFALIQEMDTPTFGFMQVSSEFNLEGTIEGEDIFAKSKSNVYLDISSQEDEYLYATLDLEFRGMDVEVDGTGIIYYNADKVYLDIDASVKNGGSTVNYDAKEMMEVDTGGLGITPDDLDMSGVWEQFQDLDYNEVAEMLEEENLEMLLDFIKIYKNKDKVRVVISVTKEKILDLELFDDAQTTEVFESITDGSKIEFVVEFNNKKITNIKLEFDFEIDYQDVRIDTDGFVEFKMNPRKPSLPRQSELDKFTKVEQFSILDQLIPRVAF